MSQDGYLYEYTIKFIHHKIVRTEAVVIADNDVKALALAFEQLIAEGWNKPGDLTWTGSGEFLIKIKGRVIGGKIKSKIPVPNKRFCDLNIGDVFTEIDGDEQSKFVKVCPVTTLTDGAILKTTVQGEGITMEPVAAHAVVANVLNLKNMTFGVLPDEIEVIYIGRLS